MSNKTALIAGATGLVGKELLKLLLDNDTYDKVKVLTRRDPGFSHQKMELIMVPDFDELETHADKLSAHHVFCCLGTTIKIAGSKEVFKKVDLDYPVLLAKLVKDQPKFESYHLVTSLGANADSPLFYNEIKGKVEDETKELGLKSLYIYRPSLLLGKRTDFRLGEEVAKAFSAFISFFAIGNTRGRLWSIHGHDVADAMVTSAFVSKEGDHLLLPKDMLDLVHP